MRRLLALTAALCAGALAPAALAAQDAAAAGERVLVWKKSDYPLDELPRRLPDEAKRAAEAWSNFAVERGFDMSVTSDGRVLILHQLPGTQAARQLRTIDRVARLLDDELPPPKPVPEDEREQDEGPKQALPEDPEGPPVQIGGHGGAPSAPWRTSWGDGQRATDTGTIVLIAAGDADDYARVLERQVELTPHLEAWRKSAAGRLGFTLEDSLLAAWITDEATALAHPEHRPDNELLHRAGELLFVRRFGWQPYWAIQGWAWHTEWSLSREVWVFPGRDEPAPPAEHEAWKKELRLQLQARQAPLEMADLVALRRGTWDGTAARYAWGTVRELVDEYSRSLSEVLAEFNRSWDRKNRIDMGGGNWRRDPAFALPPEVQLDVLRRHTDRDVLDVLSGEFMKY